VGIHGPWNLLSETSLNGSRIGDDSFGFAVVQTFCSQMAGVLMTPEDGRQAAFASTQVQQRNSHS